MEIGNRCFETSGHTYIMGILNVTPDSFSDGGRFRERDAALFHAEKMAKDGADIIDVGGESTRPGYTRISEEEEIGRVYDVIRSLKSELDVPISIDTYKPAVAKAALDAGADMVNDVWGLQYGGGGMAEVIASRGAACCLMLNREEPSGEGFLAGVKDGLLEIFEHALSCGIPEGKIMLDPGIGFCKGYEENLETICRIGEICGLGPPVLLGASRKSVIGRALELPVGERLEGTLVTTAAAVFGGCAFVRVHDVAENKRAVRMAEAIRDGWRQRRIRA